MIFLLRQLVEFEDAEGNATTYAYDGTGMRVSKIRGEEVQKFYWDRGYIVNESLNGIFTASNSVGPEGIFERTTGSEENTQSNFLFKNAHGDVTDIVSDDEILNEYDYDAYGNQKNISPSDTNPFRYCGEYYDEESGLIYLRNRYYDPEIERFITEDPAMDGMNWYTYCSNNPVMFVDPWGLYSIVFYANGMYDQALCREDYYNDKYGTVTYLVGVNSAEEFVHSWNSFVIPPFDQELDAIEIMSHGSIVGDVGRDESGTAYSTGYLYFGTEDINRLYARPVTDMGSGDYSVYNLIFADAKELHINACNSANPDTYNVVYGFMQRTDILYETTGFDGGDVWNPNEGKYGDHTRGYGDYKFGSYFYVKKYQPTWWKYVIKVFGTPLRKRIGRLYFYS